MHYDNNVRTFTLGDLSTAGVSSNIEVAGNYVYLNPDAFGTSGATLLDNDGDFKFGLSNAGNTADVGGKTFTGTSAADTIINLDFTNLKIDAGEGNDSITNRSSNVTISTGGGSDTVFAYAGISFTVTDFAVDDVIQLFDGANTLAVSSIATVISCGV